MFIILRKCRFLHIPKTGGEWVAAVLKNLESASWAGNFNASHADLRQAPGEGMFTFCTVRDPFGWYESYWRYRMENGWQLNLDFDRQVVDSRFECYLEKMLTLFPNYFTEVLQLYIGANGDLCDMLMRFSDLTEDLVRVLSYVGELRDPELVRKRPRVNESKWPRQVISSELKLRVEEVNLFGFTMLEKARLQQEDLIEQSA